MEVTFPSADGCSLHGRLTTPAATATPTRGLAVLCHPHPAFGGTMDVWLLPTIADRLAADGWEVLRFDFRGVGASDGSQTGGRDEHLDVLGALAWLRERHGAGLPVVAVGWSFGAMASLRVGAAVDAWVGIGAPTRSGAVPLEGPLVPDVLPPRRTVIVGDADQFFPADTVGVLQPHEVLVVPDADHFLFDRDPEVADLVAGALAPVLETGGPQQEAS